jgi:ADP-ribosyl-[dinitrogen reductase] hydrolase
VQFARASFRSDIGGNISKGMVQELPKSLAASPESRASMKTIFEERCAGIAWGSFIGDALAMPVHWYYDRAALRRDYGIVRDYLAPRNPHPDSILWRSKYAAFNPRGEILHEQSRYWGRRGIHYHQFLRAGENTLNLQLAKVLIESLIVRADYDAEDYLRRYIEFMLTPGTHRDTYIEECHRKFFTKYAHGAAPRESGSRDICIGGLAHVGILCAFFRSDTKNARYAVREHIALTHRASEILEAGDALARILCAVFSGADLREAIFAEAGDWLPRNKALEWSRYPDDTVVGEMLSPACYVPDAFAASLYLAWKYADDFESGVIANTNVGGENCHRGAVIGAMLGGVAGRNSLPARLIQGFEGAADLRARINALITVAARV